MTGLTAFHFSHLTWGSGGGNRYPWDEDYDDGLPTDIAAVIKFVTENCPLLEDLHLGFDEEAACESCIDGGMLFLSVPSSWKSSLKKLAIHKLYGSSDNVRSFFEKLDALQELKLCDNSLHRQINPVGINSAALLPNIRSFCGTLQFAEVLMRSTRPIQQVSLFYHEIPGSLTFLRSLCFCDAYIFRENTIQSLFQNLSQHAIMWSFVTPWSILLVMSRSSLKYSTLGKITIFDFPEPVRICSPFIIFGF